MFSISSSLAHIVLEVFKFSGCSVTGAGVACCLLGGWLAGGVSGGMLVGVFFLSRVTVAVAGFCSIGLDRGCLFRSALFR